MARKHIRWASKGLALATLAAGLALASPAQSHAQTPAGTLPSPSPSPPPASFSGAFTIAAFHSVQANASGALDTASGRDALDRADISNLLVNLAAGSGRLHASATVGSYSFPTVGQAMNPTVQPGANTNLYTALPLAQVLYTFDNHVSLSAGKLAALLGSESIFTYQNLNVQRGLGWALEPVISRGIRAAYVNGALSATLELDDAYYSGSGRALEALVGYAPSANSSVQVAAILPRGSLGSNPTTAIGNKAEYNVMYSRQIGKLQLAPYLLWVRSRADATLGYTRTERASAAVVIASYAFSAPLSLAVRFEDVRNASAISDPSPNADLIGYGAGSAARTLTITPAWHMGFGLARLEYSRVWLSAYAPGSGFGPAGSGSAQNRFGLEIGLVK